ncbi:hypothetical protein VTN49DRAFT_6179 [Thermomyces lanuginosus]|uniref:uncharacterized protein n=1 Tax=Thermomyces lanuginosus TaxID=5541 RepID=UPI0037433E00
MTARYNRAYLDYDEESLRKSTGRIHCTKQTHSSHGVLLRCRRSRQAPHHCPSRSAILPVRCHCIGRFHVVFLDVPSKEGWSGVVGVEAPVGSLKESTFCTTVRHRRCADRFFPLPKECAIERTGACGWDIWSVRLGCGCGNGSEHCTYKITGITAIHHRIECLTQDYIFSIYMLLWYK